MKRKARLFLGTQNAQNYMKREAMPLLWHAECAELYESQSDAKFAYDRFQRILRFLREVLTYLAPIKSLRE